VADFSLTDTGGPDILGTTVYPSGDDTAGPYVIESYITDFTAVAEQHFYYTSSASGGPFELPLTVLDPQSGHVRAQIPGQPLGTRVQYWLTAEDVVGNASADPAGAPFDVYAFVVAAASDFYVADMEVTGNWTVGDVGDAATTGIWARGEPDGTYDGGVTIQPETDHTPSPGTDCWVTGNAATDDQGVDDVDGGKTTLKSPVFDLGDYGGVGVSYFRWYTNDTGSSPGIDIWRVQVTDGDGWVDLENTNTSNRSWLERSFLLEDYVDLTSTVQLRFIAEDAGSGSIVEAAVDDFKLSGYSSAPDAAPPTVTVVQPNGGEFIAAGGTYEVLWNAADDIGVVHVEVLLSIDSGATYPTTVAAGPYDGSFSWTVPAIVSETCRLRVVAYDAVQNATSDDSDADFRITGATPADDVPVQRLTLDQNHPNPFNPRTEIHFALPRAQEVQLRIYDVEGRLVRTLVAEPRQAGRHAVVWSGDNDRGERVASGLYFYRLTTEESSLTRKMMLLK
jgi:hypothetical protein